MAESYDQIEMLAAETLPDIVSIKEEIKEEPQSPNNDVQIPASTPDLADEDDLRCLDEPFCFESDHVALKTNPDYQRLLRTIIMLEAQRTAALKDLDTLIAMKADALADPMRFVALLQNSRDDAGIPRPQKVATLPNIEWDRYTKGVEAALSGGGGMRGGGGPGAPLTRNKIRSVLLSSVKDEPEVKPEPVSVADSAEDRKPLKQHSATHNVKWDREEQQLFERLLVVHKEERNQSNRFRKIAKAMGTRTVAQVASRYQKYDLKLKRHGFSLPGHAPNPAALRRRGGRRGSGRSRPRYSELFAGGQTSTFLSSFELPVCMSDSESDHEGNFGNEFEPYVAATRNGNVMDDLTSSSSSDDDDIPGHLKSSTEYRELRMLRQVKRRGRHDVATLSVSCSACRKVVTGTTWRCVECSGDVRLCVACSAMGGFREGAHAPDHLLERVEGAGGEGGDIGVDEDYGYSAAEAYSYLDPNYRPDALS